MNLNPCRNTRVLLFAGKVKEFAEKNVMCYYELMNEYVEGERYVKEP